MVRMAAVPEQEVEGVDHELVRSSSSEPIAASHWPRSPLVVDVLGRKSVVDMMAGLAPV